MNILVLVVLSCCLVWNGDGRSREQLSQDYDEVTEFVSMRPMPGEVTDIYNDLRIDRTNIDLEENTKVKVIFPPANKEFVQDFGFTPIPMIEESTIRCQLKFRGAHLGDTYEGTLESFTINGNSEQEVVFTFTSPVLDFYWTTIIFQNVRLPYIQYLPEHAQPLTLYFLDGSDTTYLEVSTIIRSQVSRRFGESTILTHSDNKLSLRLETPIPLPSGVYLRLIHFPGYNDVVDNPSFNCISECGSSASFSYDEELDVIQVDGILDSDISTEGTVMQFEIDGLTLPGLNRREIFYYVVGYNEGIILEGQKALGLPEEPLDLEFQFFCKVCPEVFDDLDEGCLESHKNYFKTLLVSYQIECELFQSITSVEGKMSLIPTDDIVLELPKSYKLDDSQASTAVTQGDEDQESTLEPGALLNVEADHIMDFEENSITFTNLQQLQYFQAFDFEQKKFTPRLDIYFMPVKNTNFVQKIARIFQKYKVFVYDQEGNLIAETKSISYSIDYSYGYYSPIW